MVKKALVVSGWMALAVAFSPAHAAPPPTHLNQPAVSEHVVLVDRYMSGGSKICWTLSFKDRALFRSFPNGTLAAEPFEVPEGHSLVITDVEWAAYGDAGGAPPLLVGNTLRLKIGLAVPGSLAPAFASRGITLDSDGIRGIPGTSEQLTTGFVVDPGVTICPFVNQVAPASILTAVVDFIILRGYLIPKG